MNLFNFQNLKNINKLQKNHSLAATHTQWLY